MSDGTLAAPERQRAMATAVAQRYGATHIATDAREPRIPPTEVFANRVYVVYKVDGTP